MTGEELKRLMGKRLADLRLREGWTQAELGDKLGLGKSSVSMYENGQRDVGADMLFAISNLFRVSLDYLFGRSDDDSEDAYKEFKKERAAVAEKEYGEYGFEVEKASLYKNANKAISDDIADAAALIILNAMKMRQDGTLTEEQLKKILDKYT